MADAVETALISVCKPAGALKDKFFNDHPGVGAFAFRPLGVPPELAARTTQPVGTEDLVKVAQEYGPLLFVRVNNKPAVNETEGVVPGYDLANPPTDQQIAHRMREAWQLASRIPGLIANPDTSPALLVGVTGGPGTQTIIGCAPIDRGGWNEAKRIDGNLVIVPLAGTTIDVAELRGRPILRDAGLRFDRAKYAHFRLFGPKGSWSRLASPPTNRAVKYVDELRHRFGCALQILGHIRRANSQGRKSRRSTRRAAFSVRSRPQSGHGTRARPLAAAVGPRAG